MVLSDTEFSGRVALVTGAASGIGLSVVEQLHTVGARVLCCDYDGAKLATALAKYADDPKIKTQVFDVSAADACAAAVEACVSQFGQLDILCNVAGMSQIAHFIDISVEDWARIVAVNTSSVFYLSKYAMPHLLKTSGNIVNIASTAGIAGLPYNAGYCASKGAVVQLSKALAVEYAGRGVRVNVICPGAVDTPLAQAINLPKDADMALFQRMFPLVRPVAAPADIAAQVLHLASSASRFITGAVHVIDGGQTAV